ncbi:MAG TPA: hypothetical protein VOB72_03190 [Candidatus Dormibacteraeota bacterium]|nr:hypothetical protein [Candidatus Dormibacteraeota bacterium]
MWGSRLRRGALVAAAVGGSQLGHALVYLARYGVGAGAEQSAGAHAYFPMLTAGLSAGLGGLLTLGLVLVAAARTLPRPACRPRATARFLDLLPLFFLGQMVVFMGQEAVEAAAAGGPVPSAIELLFWGTLGQLPAAVIAAAVACWLLARVEAALTALVVATAELLSRPLAATEDRATRPEPAIRLALDSVFPAAFRKRGPPLLRASAVI